MSKNINFKNEIEYLRNKTQNYSILLEECKISVRDLLYKCPLIIRWGVYSVIIILILFGCTRVGDAGGFMYANF